LAADLHQLRASQNLLNETAASIAAVSVELMTLVPEKAVTHLSFGKPAKTAAISTGRGAFVRVDYIRGAVVVAVLTIFSAILFSRFPGRQSSTRLASAGLPSLPITSPHPQPRMDVIQLPLPVPHPIQAKRTIGGSQPAQARTKAPVRPVPVALKAESPEPVSLDIEIRHQFVIARVMVWLDGGLVYEKELRGITNKHALVFQRTVGFDVAAIKTPAGAHTVKVRVQSGSDSYDLSKSISGAFVAGTKSTLLITCDRRHNLLVLGLQ
jgi:hypothetical protein